MTRFQRFLAAALYVLGAIAFKWAGDVTHALPLYVFFAGYAVMGALVLFYPAALSIETE